MQAKKKNGRAKALIMIAIVLQVILSVGSLSQIITEVARGGSLLLYDCPLTRTLLDKALDDVFRFFGYSGSLTLVPEFYLRVEYWPEKCSFLASPFMLWCCSLFLLKDFLYGVCIWYIKRSEGTVKIPQVREKPARTCSAM